MIFLIILGSVLIIGCIVFVIIASKLHYEAVKMSREELWLINEFSRCNCIVFGKKGTGKDLLFAFVIWLRQSNHYSNIVYNSQTQLVNLKDISLGSNTFENCVNGNIQKQEPIFEEETDFYISDGGIYLPCQYNKELNNTYPSMPMFYALSRHLYNCNIHVNVQNVNRLWDKLREQADSFIRTIKTEDKGDYLIVTAISYDNYASAESGLLPSVDIQYISTHGQILKHKFKIPKYALQYDSRYFKDVFLNGSGQNKSLKGVLRRVKR